MNIQQKLLNAENIIKRFPSGQGYLEVLKGVNLDLNPGQLTILSGPSGSGKSTLLYLLGGLDKPDEGIIRFKGEEVSTFSTSRLDDYRNHKIGFVFQMHYLMPDFTAIENVIMPAMINGLSKSEAVEKAMPILSALSILDRKDHYPNQLSGGEQQRTAVARALINSPEIIFADEPTGNLDRENSISLLKLFRDFVENTGVSFLIATHDPELAKLGEIQFHLVDGRLNS